MPNTREEWEELFKERWRIFNADQTQRSYSLYRNVADCLEHAIKAEEHLEAVDHYYNIYLDLLNHP